MKLKQLIKKLQEIDEKYGNEEELHVCSGNIDISDVVLLPAYYDGSQQVVVRDEKGYPISGRYKRKGYKIELYTSSFAELIWDRDEFNIDYSELGEERQKSYKENHNKIVEKRKELDYKLELEHFVKHMERRATGLIDGIMDSNIKNEAEKFFDENLSANAPIPQDIKDYIKYSYNNMRDIQWDRELQLDFDGYGFKISRKL